MKQKILLFFLSTLLSGGLYAQKEANWWFFGHGNSLNFNNTTTISDDQGRVTDGMPQAGTGNITTDEGCFTLSDKNGNLMIYSDGMTIWNKNGVALPNGSGLLGGPSSTQSGIIVPYPGDPDKYYAISVAQERTTSGITYSVVDMTAQGGLGDVISGQKSLILRAGPTDENIAAVKKKGSDNYWIMHRDIVGNICTFYLWELTPSGFTGPTTYTLTLNISSNHLGYLKFTSDATRFACPVWTQGSMLSGEFDAETGQVSNLQCRNVGFHAQVYSFEFSLSGDHLYMTTAPNNSLAHISWENLRNSTLSATNLNKGTGNVQMHPDGRIYGTGKSVTHLIVIMDPESGANADIRTFSNYLPTGASWGLPTFAASYMRVEGETGFCVNTSQDFSVSLNNSSIAYTIWNFGDGSPEIKDDDVSTGKQTHSYTYTRSGKYIISVKSFDSDDNLLQQESIEAEVLPCLIPVNPNIHVWNNN
ncbi:MAG: PKD domain-containing protein [Prevotella sp.]|jgi:hypothetical protein|nr:PKD domain-containing protein [Prevotella sp.]